jgi:signal peptidase I
MQPNDTDKPNNSDSFRPNTYDPKSTTDGFARPAPNYPVPGNNNRGNMPVNKPGQNYGQAANTQPSPANQPPPAPSRYGQPPPAPSQYSRPNYQPPNRPGNPNTGAPNQQHDRTGMFRPISQPIIPDDYTGKPKAKAKREEIKNTIFTVALFILAPLFAVFMILFVFQSYVVDGSSMDPTLQNGDRVFILKLPKSLASLNNEQWVPARNEIVVFKKPSNEDTQLIKRVIGLPGDRVVIENGRITVFNIDNPGGFDPAEGTDYQDELAVYDPDQNIESNVGQGELFVLGDNRTPGGSLDSHSGLGVVPIENVVGRLWIRYFPLSSFEVFASELHQKFSFYGPDGLAV